MQGFSEIFESYGADYHTITGRFMGNELMYMKFLDMFFNDKSIEELGAALNSGHLKEAFEAAHTLKGIAANMGLDPLSQAVCAIVEPLREQRTQEDYLALYQDIKSEYQKADILRENLKAVLHM